MSLRMNNFEQKLANALQEHLTKREAESAIVEMREMIYNDGYQQMTPITIIDEIGRKSHAHPDIPAIVFAYILGDRKGLYAEFSGVFDICEPEEYIEKEDTTGYITKDMLLSRDGIQVEKGVLSHTYERNGVKLYYFGTDLHVIEIDGKSLEDALNMSESVYDVKSLLKENNEILSFILNKLNEGYEPENEQSLETENNGTEDYNVNNDFDGNIYDDYGYDDKDPSDNCGYDGIDISDN